MTGLRGKQTFKEGPEKNSPGTKMGKEWGTEATQEGATAAVRCREGETKTHCGVQFSINSTNDGKTKQEVSWVRR